MRPLLASLLAALCLAAPTLAPAQSPGQSQTSYPTATTPYDGTERATGTQDGATVQLKVTDIVAQAPSAPAVVNVTTATETAVRAAYTAAAANPGKAYIINLPASPITLSSPLPYLANVSTQCVPPYILPTSGSQSLVDSWQPNGGSSQGTVFIGNGSFAAFSANTNTVSSPTAAQFALSMIVGNHIRDCTFESFTYALQVGGTGNGGPEFSSLERSYFYGMTKAAWLITNGAYDTWEHLEITQPVQATSIACAIWRADVAVATYEPSNSHFTDIFCNSPSILPGGQGFWEDATTGSYLNQDVYYKLQADGPGGNIGVHSLSVTPNASTTAWPVSNLAYFQPGVRFTPSANANGLNANQTYYVQSASGTTGSGTIAIANCLTACSGSLISSSGTTTETWTTEYPPALRIGGSGGSVTDGYYGQLDLENNGGIDVDKGLQNTFEPDILSASTPIIDRDASQGNRYYLDNSANTVDVTGAEEYVTGQVLLNVQQASSGIVYDSGRTMYALGIGPVGHGGEQYDLEQRETGNAFIYPASGMGEHIANNGNTGFTLNGNWCGYDVNTDISTPSLTLPPILDPTNSAMVGASYQGCHQHWFNKEATTLTFSVSSSQYINGVSGLSSLIVPAYAGVDFTGANYGSTLYWSGEWVNLIGEPTYDLNALAAPAVPTSGGTITIADGTSYEGLQPISALSSLTIALPNCSGTYATHKVEFRNESAYTISSITYTAVTGAHGADLPTSLTPGQGFSARCEANASAPGWY